MVPQHMIKRLSKSRVADLTATFRCLNKLKLLPHPNYLFNWKLHFVFTCDTKSRETINQPKLWSWKIFTQGPLIFAKHFDQNSLVAALVQ
jgi:hypothetical protein